MNQKYEDFITKLGKDHKLMPTTLFKVGLNFNSFYRTLPARTFDFLWIPLIQAEGFYSALPHIQVSIKTFLLRSASIKEDAELKKMHDYTIAAIFPYVLNYKTHNCRFEEVMNRSKSLRDCWKLGQTIISHIIPFFEINEEKQNEPQSKKQKIISDLLKQFDTNQSKLDYISFGIQLLHQSVGEIVYDLKKVHFNYDEIYKKLSFINKQKIIHFLFKIRKKEHSYASILSQIVAPQNNQQTNSKIINICLLFLFTENWDRFKDGESRLKEPIVIQILAEAFGRLMYHCYGHDNNICIMFLYFLSNSKFTLYDNIKQAIVYHLLALYKLSCYSQKSHIAKLIQQIWKDKIKGVKIHQFYLEQLPHCQSKIQKTEDKSHLQQAETRSIKSKSSSMNTMLSSRTSKSKPRLTTRNKIFLDLIKKINHELRRFNLQKIYLLLQTLKKFYFSQYDERKIEESSRSVIISLIIHLIKKIEAKIKFRYYCPLLKKCIYLEAVALKERCFQGGCQINEKNDSLSQFECCYVSGEVKIQTLIVFHEKANFEEKLQTILSLKYLMEDINSNKFSNIKPQIHEQQLQSYPLQFKVYLLYKNQCIDHKKVDMKKLAIISKLLLLQSFNITNNLLVNYMFFILHQQNKKQDKNPEINMKKKLQSFSQLINSQISNGSNFERIKFFLRMWEIFENFENKISQQSLKPKDNIGNKYFQFLRRREHSIFYLAYSQVYFKMNYLKQSLYFLELHNFAKKNANYQVVSKAIKIYERLNVPFKNSMNNICKELNISPQKLKEQKAVHYGKKWDFELIVNSFLSKVNKQQDLINSYEQLYISDNPRIEVWLAYYYPYLQYFIYQIQQLKQPEQIYQSLRRYFILLKFINLKIELIRQPNMIISFNKLSAIITQIQLLRNDEEKNHLYEHLLEILQNTNEAEYLEQIYLLNLLKCKHYQKLLKHLRKDLSVSQPNANMKTKYLAHLIKYYFQRSEFDRCLSMIKVLEQRKEKICNRAQVYHLQLECKYKIMLNYTIQDYLALIKICIAQSSKEHSMEDKEEHFKYYFKIFRMLFNRYNFSTINHNQLFLQTYLEFIKKNDILTENVLYISETICYFLRFKVQKFYYPTVAEERKNKFENTIMQMFKQKLRHFIPCCNYLMKRISLNKAKNQAIKSILITVITDNPKQSIWIISFLKHFNYSRLSNPTLEDKNEISILQQIYKSVLDILKGKNSLNVNQLVWIQNLIKLSWMQGEQKKVKSDEFKKIPIPSELIYIFNTKYYINRIEDIRTLKNGKSAPLQILFNLINVEQNYNHSVKVIIKGFFGSKKYRMESNAANFFQQIGILDNDITYKIEHLTKFLVIIQHRSNNGSINSYIQDTLIDFKKIQNMTYLELEKRKQINSTDRRLLQIFDKMNKPQNQPKYSQIIFFKAASINDWWKKYNNFVRTCAQWSYLGYIVGLGDRHCDNILITEDSKLIHVDFQYSLDTGLKLPCPQWVPFRLTGFFIEPLGILGVFGMFFAQMIHTFKHFQQKQHNIWKALSHFVGSMDTNVCEEIIKRAKFENLDVRSSADGVAKLISSAKDPQLLRLMFQGWRALT